MKSQKSNFELRTKKLSTRLAANETKNADTSVGIPTVVSGLRKRLTANVTKNYKLRN